MNAENLQEQLVDNLKDLYDAEKQLVRTLPKLANAAQSEDLAKGIVEHLETTKGQVERLDRIFELLEQKAESKPCAGMKGILQEGEEHLSEEHPEELTDTILISGSRKVEHYEIVGYTSALELAQAVGNTEIARLLKQTLAEEERMDKKLATLSTRLLKPARKTARRAA